MSTLVRSDGTQFVMQAYRELLSATKRSHIAQSIRLLSEQQGQYVRLFKKGQSQYEAAFSMDPGYLLGESVWHYLGEPTHLIYCEALPDSADVLLVVVRSGAVYIDTQILGSRLQSELLPLMTGELRYRIVTSGNVPLRKAESFGTFRFPKDLIESFEALKEPLFPALPALPTMQLKPLSLALKSAQLNGRLSTPAFLLILTLVGIVGWWLFAPHQDANLHQAQTARPMAQPYLAYRRALSTPAPDQVLSELVSAVNVLYVLPGWTATTLRYHNSQYQVNVIPDGGDLPLMTQWATEHGYQFHITPQGMTLEHLSRVRARTYPRFIYKSDLVMAQLVDRLDKLLHHQAVNLGASQQRGNVKETQLTVHLDSASPELLDLVSREFNRMPLSLVSIDIKLHAGLMSGTIQLSAWGE